MNILNIKELKGKLIEDIYCAHSLYNSNKDVILYYFYTNKDDNISYLNSFKKIFKTFEFNITIVDISCDTIPEVEKYLETIIDLDADKVIGCIITNDIFSNKTYTMQYLYPYKDILLEYNTNCTVDSVLKILEYFYKKQYPTCTIIGRNTLKGLSLILQELNNYTVTQCHSKTNEEDLIRYCCNSDVIISCTGKNIITLEDIYNEDREQLVIDCGYPADIYNINGIDKYENLTITKVPGGVGLLTPYVTLLRLCKLKKRNEEFKW